MSQIKLSRAWVIYGRSATGKTSLAATFPKPILLVDINDDGTDSVSDVSELFVMKPQTWEELDDLFWYLKENPGKYKTVVIDTITQAQQMIVEELSGSRSRAGKSAGDWGTMTKQQWGDVSSRLKSWISNMKTLGLEVVFIAQERIFNMDEESDASGMIDPEVGPRLSPATMSHLCAAVSVIVNTFIREVTHKVKTPKGTKEVTKKEYSVRLGPNSYYITKVRKPKAIEVTDFLPNPTYDDIVEIIEGN